MKPSRLAKRLIAPTLLAATLVGVQVVLAAPPLPSFTVTGPNGTHTCGQYALTSNSTDPDSDIATVEWLVDGATVGSGSTFNATVGAGSHTFNVRVTDGSAGDGDLGPETVDGTPETFTVGNGGPPNAAFTATPNPAEPSAEVTFTSTSTAQGGGSISKYEWDLNGDSTYETDTGATPSAKAAYTTTGFHAVGLKVTDNCGGTDTTSPGTGVFVNNSPPTASFTVTPNPAAIGAAVAFNGTASSDTGGSIANYAWDFGDGTSSATNAGATITHPYATAGTYIVQLTGTDGSGATNTTFRQLRVNAKPLAGFSYGPLAPLIGETVTFDGSTSRDPDGTALTYAWDLDGNGTFETTGANPTHVYGAAGTVDVKLRVTDSDNTVSDVAQRTVTVQATRPTAGFTYAPHDPLPGQAVTLTSTSSPSASPGAPSLVATQWDFAYSPLVDFTLDGAGASIVTSFAQAGPHTVAVKVTETGGGYAIASDTIVVNAPPRAAFTVSPAKPKEGKEVTFASTASDPDGPIVKQEWNLDGNTTFEKTGPVASTTKLKKGPHTIALRVTDSKGAQATSTQVITVKAPDLRNPQDLGSVLSYLRHSWGVDVVEFTIKTPAQTSVAVSCKGRGCPHGTFHKRTRKKAATLVFPKLTGNLRAGAKINIIFTKTGRLTGWDVYTVGHGKSVLREGCRLPGAKKQKPCP
jgi:PKD repeat protein